MAQRFRIIDGYNLLHAAGFAQERFGPGGLERSRLRLLRFLANRLDPEERRRTTIVFDARTIPVEGVAEQKFEEMTILFNQAGSDADTLIEELILAHSAPKQLEVVSGDRRLQKAIKRRKGIPVESDSFARMLRDRESIVPGSAQDIEQSADADADSDKQKPSEADTAEWLKVFGEESVGESADVSLQEPAPDEASSWDAHVQELMDDLDNGSFDTKGRRDRGPGRNSKKGR